MVVSGCKDVGGVDWRVIEFGIDKFKLAGRDLDWNGRIEKVLVGDEMERVEFFRDDGVMAAFGRTWFTSISFIK